MPRLFTAIEVPAETARALAATARRPLRRALDRPRGLSRHAALHRRRRRAHRERDRRRLDEVRRPAGVDRIRGPELVRRRQAARDRRADQANRGADRPAGRAGAPPASARPAAGDAQLLAACHAGAVCARLAARRRRLSGVRGGVLAPGFEAARFVLYSRRAIRSAAAPISSRPPILCAEGRTCRCISTPSAAASRSIRAIPRSSATPIPPIARFGDAAPVFFWEEYGFWCFARHADVSALLRDRRFGRQILHVATRESLGWPEPPAHLEPFDAIERHSLLELEPPEHTRLRALVNRAFVSRQVERLAPRHRRARASADRRLRGATARRI